jgi:hypothetical protein
MDGRGTSSRPLHGRHARNRWRLGSPIGGRRGRAGFSGPIFATGGYWEGRWDLRQPVVAIYCGGDQVPVWVAVRHQWWQNFRTEILAYSKRDGYPIYAPLTHVDLRVIPSWNDGRRARAIVRSISPLSRTVLDIGAQLGLYVRGTGKDRPELHGLGGRS